MLADVTAATNNGVTTRVVINTASGVTFEEGVAVVIGGTTVVLANVKTATNNVQEDTMESLRVDVKELKNSNHKLEVERDEKARKHEMQITQLEIDLQNLTSAQASMAKANDMNAVFNQVVAQSRRLTRQT